MWTVFVCINLTFSGKRRRYTLDQIEREEFAEETESERPESEPEVGPERAESEPEVSLESEPKIRSFEPKVPAGTCDVDPHS